MLPVLGSEVVVDLVAYCDTLLYKVICNVLITSPLQNLPERYSNSLCYIHYITMITLEETRWFTSLQLIVLIRNVVVICIVRYINFFSCSLAGEYRMFSDMLRQWMEVALKGLPESLQEAKYKGKMIGC